MSAEEIVALAMTAAIKIAKETDLEELAIVSDFFTLIGAALMTIADRNALNHNDAAGAAGGDKTGAAS